MMFLQGQESQAVSEFTGPQQTVRIDNLGATQAVSAYNCEYTEKGVGARRGFETFISIAGNISSFRNWLSSAFNRIVYTTANQLRIWGLTIASNTLAYTASGSITHASYEEVGNSMYVALLQRNFTAGQFVLNGLETVIISQDVTTPGIVNADPIWQPAPSAALFTGLSQTLFGAGSTTAGIHHVAIVVTTRSGQVCPPITVGSVTFEQNKSYTISITVGAGIAAAYYRMQFAITEAGAGVNGRYYIIPDVLNSFLLTGGGTRTLGLGLSDTTLISTGTDTLPFFQNFYQGQLIQGSPVTLRPSFVKAYENRLAFSVQIPASNVPGAQLESALLFSDAGLPQSVALDRSIVQLPGAKPITAGATLKGAFYVFGPTYTYVLYSSVDDPVTWATAQLIDGQIGAPDPFCVDTNVSKGVIWVANSAGLWALIGGQYQQIPISWFCEDWQYIIWSVPGFQMVVDDPIQQTVQVSVTMGGHPVYGSRNMIFVFDYKNGISYNTVRYSAHSVFNDLGGNSSGDVRIGSVVDNTKNLRFAKTLGTQLLLRRYLPYDPQRFYDQSDFPTNTMTPVVSEYIHAPLPTENSNPIKLNGVQFRIATQDGVVNPSILARDGSRPTALLPITTASPAVTDDVTTRYFDKQSNGIQVKLNAIGGWFLDWLKVFWTPFAWNK